MSYLKDIEQQIKLLQETLQETRRAIHNAEHNIFRQVSSEEIESLKEKCMGDDLYSVSFHYTIEFLGRDNGVYVDTRYYGYWRLEETGEWTRLDIEEGE